MLQQARYIRGEDDQIFIGQPAWVTMTKHPKLPAGPVRTSTVVSYDADTGVFRTLNTVYTPEASQ